MFGGASVGALLLRFGLALPLVISGACVLVATVAYASASRTGMQSREPQQLKAAGE
jgi:hypothetical protein